MNRCDVINLLIRRYNYKRYLEIGTRNDGSLSSVKCDYKVGVDPNPLFHSQDNSDEFFTCSSDEFFEQNRSTFDIIFVDGLHTRDQAKLDIQNSLFSLAENGSVVVHDLCPLRIEDTDPAIHGNVWKAWMDLRRWKTIEMKVLDSDYGIGIIRRGQQMAFKVKEDQLTFENFDKNRKEWLNIVSEGEI